MKNIVTAARAVKRETLADQHPQYVVQGTKILRFPAASKRLTMGDARGALTNVDVEVYGEPNDALLDMPVHVSFGKGQYAGQGDTREKTLTVRDLLNDHFTRFAEGPKDEARFVCQGEVEDRWRRKDHIRRTSLLLFDYDTGVSFDATVKWAVDTGHFAVVYTSFSNGKTTTTVSRHRLCAFLGIDKASDYVPTDADVLRYRREVLKVREDHLQGTCIGSFKEDGKQIVVKHTALPKLRLLLVLKEPFDFGEPETEERDRLIDLWTDTYLAVNDVMPSVDADPACADCSRLFFLPNVAPGTVIVEGQHRIAVVHGVPFDLAGVKVTPREAVHKGGGTAARRKAERVTEQRLPGMAEFMRAYGARLDVEEIVKDFSQGKQEPRKDGGLECECPDGGSHSGDNPRGFFVQNAGWMLRGKVINQPVMHCCHGSHDGWKTADFIECLVCGATAGDDDDAIEITHAADLWRYVRDRKPGEVCSVIRACASVEEAERLIAELPDRPEDARRVYKPLIERIAAGMFDPPELLIILKSLEKKTDLSVVTLRQSVLVVQKEIEKRLLVSSEIDQVVRDFNKQCVTFEGRGKVEYLVLDVPPGRLPKQYDFKNFEQTRAFATTAVVINPHTKKPEKINVVNYWLAPGSERRIVSALEFAPPGAPPLLPETLNVWNGWPVLEDVSKLPTDELEYRCRLYLRHVRRVIANGIKERAEWALDWLADIVQRPGHKPGTSLAIVGDFGGGKSTFWEMLAPIFGDWLLKMNSTHQTSGEFTDHRSCKLLLIYEEVSHAGDHAGQKQQRDETTSDMQLVNTKFRSAVYMRDYGRKLYVGNSLTQLTKIDKGDRRVTVMQTSDKLEKLRIEKPEIQKAYFAALRKQMLQEGGCAALAEWLRRRAYDPNTLREALPTFDKDAMMQGQLDPAERWLVDAVQLGEFGSDARDPDCPADGLKAINLETLENEATGRIEMAQEDGGAKLVRLRDGCLKLAVPQREMRLHFRDALSRAPERYKVAEVGTVTGLGGALETVLGALPERSKQRVSKAGVSVWCWLLPTLPEMRDRLIEAGYINETEEVFAEEEGG